MREIKFRAWDGSSMSQNAKTIQEIASVGVQSRDPEKLEWLQYTGLKDKNGKEIYEGDVVIQPKWFSVGYLPATGEVKYLGVRFTVDCIGQWEGAHAELNGNSEVIGNIYENPELLK